MSNEFKLQVRNAEEYEMYTTEQLSETVEHFNQMINEIRVERVMVENVLKLKTLKKEMSVKLASMSAVEKDAMRQILSVDTILSAEVVNT